MLERYFKFYLSIAVVAALMAVHTGTHAQSATPQTYPKITGYVGIMHPLVTFSSTGTETNFSHYYVVGMPTGINLWKSSHIGFSAEFVPFIRAEHGTSKMSNFLFHPGVLVALGKGYTFIGRAAFETSGRYGLTPIFNKTIIKSKSCSYYAAVPLPLRFGNDRPTTFAIAFQFGVAF
jgi:hypothetical protein